VGEHLFFGVVQVMSDWTSGYVADIGYTYGYYSELNPLRIKLAFLTQGLVFPQVGTACELGFGQGLSANLHGAAALTEWWGTDFNPSQAGYAQQLAQVSGGAVKLYDESFAQFAQRSDLPEFDFIGLHGIWSWISDENRAVIVDFIGRKLKVGGVLYISYNTLPGWSTFAPMRHLLTEHAELLGAEGRGIVSRINGALDFSDKLLATNPIFARANPQVAERLSKMKTLSRHYLAHEYFNRDWHPMHVAEMGEWLAPAKLQYACSAHYLDHIEGIQLSVEQQAFLKEIPDAMFRETVRDFMVNQQFRRDYWVKGARKLSTLEQTELLRELRFLLLSPRSEVSLKVTGAQGEGEMSKSVYGPILERLAGHRVMSLAEIETALKGHEISFAQLAQAVLLLSGVGHLGIVQDDGVIGKVKRQTEQLNRYLCQQARVNNDVAYLASPVTGGGVTVNRFQQLFIYSLWQGKKQPEAWADMAWAILQSQGQKILKEGKVIEQPDDNRAELLAQAQRFEQHQLPILRALQVL